MKIILITLSLLTFLAISSGCSSKQFNDNVDSISGDITEAVK